MDTSFTSHLILSIVLFAPGLVLLASLAFVGLLMLLEKTVLSKNNIPQGDLRLVDNPTPGPIVTGLQDAIQDEKNKKRDTKVA